MDYSGRFRPRQGTAQKEDRKNSHSRLRQIRRSDPPQLPRLAQDLGAALAQRGEGVGSAIGGDSEEVGQLFQSESGHDSDLKPAECSDTMSVTFENAL
jgi:hypothetical protein